MPVFATLFHSFFTALLVFLGRVMAARLAIRVAGVAAIVGFGTALMAVFNGVVAPLAAQLFATSYGQLLGLAFPPVAGTCIAGIATTWAACTTYKLQVEAVKLTAGL